MLDMCVFVLFVFCILFVDSVWIGLLVVAFVVIMVVIVICLGVVYSGLICDFIVGLGVCLDWLFLVEVYCMLGCCAIFLSLWLRCAVFGIWRLDVCWGFGDW